MQCYNCTDLLLSFNRQDLSLHGYVEIYSPYTSQCLVFNIAIGHQYEETVKFITKVLPKDFGKSHFTDLKGVGAAQIPAINGPTNM